MTRVAKWLRCPFCACVKRAGEFPLTVQRAFRVGLVDDASTRTCPACGVVAGAFEFKTARPPGAKPAAKPEARKAEGEGQAAKAPADSVPWWAR